MAEIEIFPFFKKYFSFNDVNPLINYSEITEYLVVSVFSNEYYLFPV